MQKNSTFQGTNNFKIYLKNQEDEKMKIKKQRYTRKKNLEEFKDGWNSNKLNSFSSICGRSEFGTTDKRALFLDLDLSFISKLILLKSRQLLYALIIIIIQYLTLTTL